MQSEDDPTPQGGESPRPIAPEEMLAALDHAPVGVGFANADLELIYANRRWRELWGFDGTLPASPETMLELVHPDDRQLVADAFVRSDSGGDRIRERVRVLIGEGEARHLTLSLSHLPAEQQGYAIGLSDVTELVAALEEVRKSEQRFRSVTSALPIGVYRADPAGGLLWANRRLQEMGRYYEVEGRGTSIYAFTHPDDVDELQRLAREAIRRKGPFEAQHRLVGSDGSVRWVISRSSPILDEHGEIIEHIGSLEDVTELHLRSVGLAHQAAHDPLTGLPNRASIEEMLGALASQDHGGHAGVVFLDLDGFKAVNDTHGHQAGDAVLVEVARRLDAVIREDDTVGRYGGDEFVVVCPNVDDDAALDRVARRVQQAISGADISDGERTHSIGVSVGTALGRDADSVDDLLHRADTAMYEAKHSRD